jgi:hypothetical protein
MARHAVGVATSVAAVAIVTAAIFALEPFAPVRSSARQRSKAAR